VAEEQDAWLDLPGTRHRMMFDTTSFKAAGDAVHFANNFYHANESGYGLKPNTLGVLIILRAMSTPLGYNDAIWSKYGDGLAKFMELEGDAGKRAAMHNPLYTGSVPEQRAGDPVTLASLQQKGARFAVCGSATHGIAAMLAKGAAKSAAEVEAEIRANLIPGAQIVPAGIVAVNRAQEHGYAFSMVP
jgi:intracellular sulfur oxidation DsrE/DsrF family protein